MALPDWILGVLLRPGQTFERARAEMRHAHWMILLCVLTVEVILTYYHPSIQGQIPSISFGVVFNGLSNLLMLIYMAQVLLLFGIARLYGWALTMGESLKYTGLLWSIFLLEDLVTFVPYLKEQNLLLLWVSIPFMIWRVIAHTEGVHRLSGLSRSRSASLVIMATLPWQVPLFYANWLSTMSGQ